MKKFSIVLLASLLVVTIFFGVPLAKGLFDRDDQAIYGNWNIYNTWRWWSGSTMNVDGTLDLTDATITATGKITATHIANPERTIHLPLAAAFIDGTGVIGNDGTTAPGLAETDNVPAIVYASSAETTKIQWTFKVPDDYVSGLGFRLLVSSSNASGALMSVDWQLWINDDDTTFDAAAVVQDAVTGTIATLDASNEELVFTMDATGAAAVSAGNYVTVDFFNAHTGATGTTEIKGVQAYYTATM